MKVAIITLFGVTNIGNRLQNYAVQELLKARGCQASTLMYEFCDEEGSISYRFKVFLQSLLIRSGIYNSYFFLRYYKKAPKMVLLEEFNRKYVNLTRKYYFKTSRMSKYKDDFDYYCVGSDQIWNPLMVQNNDFFFVGFAPSEQSFSLSVSMGVTSVDSKYQENYRKGFEHIGHISVRESSLQKMIKETTGRDSIVLLDPTLLLERSQWHSMARKPAFHLPERYLATYFLSELTPAQQTLLEDYARDNDMAIIDINQTYSNYIGPLEFLYVIENAQFLFTDSFHGTAFSIIFGKDFLAFQRNKSQNMSSRITTILQTFKLENRFYCGNNQQLDESLRDRIEQIKTQDTSHVGPILMEEKQKAYDFLKNVLAGKDKK